MRVSCIQQLLSVKQNALFPVCTILNTCLFTGGGGCTCMWGQWAACTAVLSFYQAGPGTELWLAGSAAARLPTKPFPHPIPLMVCTHNESHPVSGDFSSHHRTASWQVTHPLLLCLLLHGRISNIILMWLPGGSTFFNIYMTLDDWAGTCEHLGQWPWLLLGLNSRWVSSVELWRPGYVPKILHDTIIGRGDMTFML